MRRSLIAFLAPLSIALSLAWPARAADADPDLKIPFEKYTLPNGLEVILHPDHKVPVVVVDLWYHVGSSDETYGKSGFAHLFEHLMFEGSGHVKEANQFDYVLRNAGASNNGSTTTDRTNFYEILPAHQLETALWLESDRMGYLLDTMTEPTMNIQREVVRNERRQSYDTQPYSLDWFASAKMVYPEGNPYRYLTIGLHEDVAGATLDDVKGFFRKWYVPANCTLAIGGDFETAATKALIEKWFGTFPKSEKPAHRKTAFVPLSRQAPTPAQASEGPEWWRKTVNDPYASLRRVHYVWVTPGLYEPGDAELDLLASVLARYGTGRLYKILVHDKELAQSVGARQESTGHTFDLNVDLKTGADMAEMERIVDEELERVRREPVSPRELERAAIGYESSFVWGLEDVHTVLELLQGYNHFTGDAGYINKDIGRYRAATAAGLLNAATRYLSRDARGEIVTLPAPRTPGGAQ